MINPTTIQSMNKELKEVSTATFGGRKFRKQQIIDIQRTVSTFPGLSRSELAHTICEHVNWTTPRGTNRIQTCLNALEEMEVTGIIPLCRRRMKPSIVENVHLCACLK